MAVTAAFWVWILVAGCVGVAAIVFVTGPMWQEARAARAAAGDTDVDGIFTAYRVWFVALFVLVLGLFVVLAMRMRAGRSSARGALPLLAAVALALSFSGLASSITIDSVVYRNSQWPGWLLAVLAVAATGLMFVKDANAYFKAARRG